ncbi:AAA family ATPase [Sneathiella marina]|uniref:AAA family ATPase n=1 Tax=Sneathiella marina TaxID=2950108 RepID=A0ABY4W1Q2_9PROT|nr:adenylate/guanylate cyclase domain-containing protein [Sneathiella marina]USG60879.1 AAA family ATPase [Sneathiella marina]
MADDIRRWLHEEGFEKHIDAFLENEVDMAALPFLTDSDLSELGVPLGSRRKMMSSIAQYVAFQQEGNGRPSDLQLIHRQVTILYTQIDDANLSLTQGPEKLPSQMLDSCFECVETIGAEFGGTIESRAGNAAMIVFGAPVAHTDDPERALRAALEIHRRATAFKAAFKVKIGVASGQVVAGHEKEASYTVTGDSVNLAVRLTDLATFQQTLVSAAVKNALGDRFHGELLGEKIHNGLKSSVSVWRLGRVSSLRGASPYAFVGRRRYLHQFSLALEQCAEDRSGQIFLIRGEAGIGKTRLSDEFGKLAKTKGFACHSGLVLDFGTAKGQDAIRSLLRNILEIIPGGRKKERREALERVISQGILNESQRVFLNDLLNLPQPADLGGTYDAMDNEARNLGKQEAVAQMIAAIGQKKPLMLKIEDIHWADPVILSHVAQIYQVLADCPVLLVLTTRNSGDPFTKPRARELEGISFTTVELSPLNPEEAAGIAKAFPNLNNQLIQTCIARAEGNPLYLDQLLRNAHELEKDQIPGTIQGIVQARLDTLTTPDREALQAASILGQRFSIDAIEALIEAADFDPENLLKNALIKPAPAGYQFSHALIREGVYASLIETRKLAFHKRAAAFYQDADPVLRAEHLEKAEDTTAAYAYLEAAKLQLSAFRPDVALSLVERGLALSVDDTIKFELRYLQGDLCRHLSEIDKSIKSFEKALELYDTEEQFCRAHVGLATALRIVDRSDDALTCLTKIQNIALKNRFIEILAEIHFLRGNIFFPRSMIKECMEEHKISLQYAKEVGSFEGEARALGGLGDASYGAGRMQTAHQYFKQCVELAEKHEFTRIAVANMPMIAWTALFLNNLDLAVKVAKDAIEKAVATSDKRAGLIGHMCLLEIMFCQRDFEGMKLQGEQSREATLKMDSALFQPASMICHARYQFHIENDPAAAMETCRTAFKICRETGEGFMGPWTLGAAAQIATEQKDRRWALDEGNRILQSSVISHNYFFFYAFAIESCALQGEWHEVIRYADALEKITAREPLGWSNFYIEVGRSLADIGVNGKNAKNVQRLEEIKADADDCGQLAMSALLSNVLAT